MQSGTMGSAVNLSSPVGGHGIQLSSTRKVIVRSFRESDRDAVLTLLENLPALYPDAEVWLPLRLDDVVAAHALCTVALGTGDELAGLTIETPKEVGRWKLSTVFVAEASRESGVGRALIDACSNRWSIEDVRHNYVTVRYTRLEAVLSLLQPYGFVYRTLEHHRYGHGQHEAILVRDVGSACHSMS